MSPDDLRQQQRRQVAEAAERNWRKFCQFVIDQLPSSVLRREGASAVVQSTLARVLEQIDRDGVQATSAEQLQALLWCVLRRRCIDRLRGRRPLERDLDPDEVGDQAVRDARDHDLVLINRELQERLRRLEPVDRDILALDQDGLTDVEIAQGVGLNSRDQVKRRRQRALRALRLSYGLCLNPECPEQELPTPPPYRCPYCGTEFAPQEHELALKLLPPAGSVW